MKIFKQNLITYVTILILLLLAHLSITAQNIQDKKERIKDYMPKTIPEKGFVPDEETAIRIAEAIWDPLFGERVIEKEKPFIAVLLDSNTWWVRGTLYADYGGVAEILIDKSTCKIIGVGHDK